MVLLGSGGVLWALLDLHSLLDEPKGWGALVAAPILVVIGIHRLRTASSAE